MLSYEHELRPDSLIFPYSNPCSPPGEAENEGSHRVMSVPHWL